MSALIFKVGDAVTLKADLYEAADDHSPGGYLARKGELLLVRRVRTDYTLPWSDPLCISVSHEDRTDGMTFSVRQSEIEATPAPIPKEPTP